MKAIKLWGRRGDFIWHAEVCQRAQCSQLDVRQRLRNMWREAVCGIFIESKICLQCFKTQVTMAQYRGMLILQFLLVSCSIANILAEEVPPSTLHVANSDNQPVLINGDERSVDDVREIEVLHINQSIIPSHEFSTIPLFRHVMCGALLL